ncbi:MAG: hypothetical protein QNK37_29430 [Acidobacteriota bacterium]|nr:hypothetical protein [Acidobacteriota bacterium]
MAVLIPAYAQDDDLCDFLRASGAPVSDCFVNADGFGYTINACRPIRFELNTSNYILTVDDQSFDLTDTGRVFEYAEYVNNICGYGDYVNGVPVGTPTDPVVQQALQSIQFRMTANRATPKEVQKEEGASRGITFNQFGTNLGVGDFDFNGVEGRSSSALLGYTHAWGSGFTLNGNYFYNKLALDQSDDLANSTISLSLEKSFGLAGFDARAGAGYSYLFLSDKYSESDGRSFNLFLTGYRNYKNGSVLNLGLMHQVTEAGLLENSVTGLSALYGLPIGSRGALNVEATLFETSQELNGRDPGLDSNFSSAGILYDYYLGSFVINVGAKKIVGLDGYSNIDYVLSGSIRY